MRILTNNSVKIIENVAFGECSSLKRIDIPGSVTKIGHIVFSGCSNLQEIHLRNKNLKTMSIEVDILRDIDKSQCTVYVPIGTEEEYRKHPAFDGFKVVGE